MPKHEERNVLTLWGHRGWHVPNNDQDYDTSSLNRGYKHLNEAVQDIAKQVTIHSVAHSSIPLPYQGVVQLLYVSATIVYSGDLDVRKVGDVKVDRTKPVSGTVFEIHM